MVDQDDFSSISWHSDHQTGGSSDAKMGGGSGSGAERSGSIRRNSDEIAGLPSPGGRQQPGEDMQPNFERMDGVAMVSQCPITAGHSFQ